MMKATEIYIKGINTQKNIPKKLMTQQQSIFKPNIIIVITHRLVDIKLMNNKYSNKRNINYLTTFLQLVFLGKINLVFKILYIVINNFFYKIMDEHPNSYIQLPKLDETEQKSVLIAKFKAVTNQKYQKMLADKKETPTLVIPKSIPIFIATQLFMDLVLAIYDYLQQFISIIRKQKLLNKKLDGRINKQSELLRFDKHTLVQKQKQISIYYSSVLLKYSSKSSNKDQFFFQTLIYLISKILKSFYNREQYPIIEEETNRLFRTNRYNIIKKRHQNDQLLREYPVLKDINDQTKPLNVNCIISKAEEKSRAIKQMTKRNRLRTIIRDRNADTISLSNTPIQLPDSSQRSPILSTWLPSNRLRIKEFSRQRDMQISTIQRKKFKDEELDRIIKKSYFMDDQYY